MEEKDGTFLGKYLIVRHIVSDSDKLEALGIVGIKRCVEYTKERNPHISKDEIKEKVVEHADEKLLRLDKYIMTEMGKFLVERYKRDTEFLLNHLDIFI